MVKNIFSNLSRGIFYTLGKIIAWFLIGIGIVFLSHYLGIEHILEVL